MHVGRFIHAARKAKKMTLSELSQGSGVALATLSRIENGKMTGTIDSHMRICRTLEMQLPDLYKDLVASDSKIELRERKTGTSVSTRAKRFASEILVSNAMSKKMLPAIRRIQKGGSTQVEETKTGAEKFVFLLEGRIDAVVGDKTYKLKKGDTMYFDASTPHHFINTSQVEASLLSVTCPPTI